ncbi:glycerophosphodiester phosphodiesterase [Streptomyces tsukubensis]|uniref:Glycerophosphodiester phosphodiesterase n=1 Tax=Streptomyces tsukubensis TaxID=83656 RepID=A0A1V4A407_9ACTN|nr:glycerophosphodiester phosphodiesterase family protein [Streptomyces tsukubensis]OON74698.1 glycerophosphodiester phosphodiesterase [Streptomyces tsukubensis]
MYARPAAAAAAAILGFGALIILPATTTQAAPAAPATKGSGPARTVAHDRPTVVAHRGASAQAPENTLAAVDKAHALGFTWVENDVQRTKDGKLVVVHDDTLARTTDVEQRYPDRAPWNVKDFTAAEIAGLDAGGWFSPAYEGARIPTLKQYLQRITHNRQNLLLELKSPDLYPGIEKETLRELRNDGWLDRRHVDGRLIIQSFSAPSVREVHAQRPDVKTGFLGTPSVAQLPEYAKFTDQINPSHTGLDQAYVSAVHSLKGPHDKPLELFTWTVDDKDTSVRLAGLGVDGIISNNPSVVRDALGGRD